MDFKMQQQLNQLFNREDLGVALLNAADLSRFFYNMNDCLKTYFQYDEDEINSLSLSDITHPDDTAHTLEFGKRILKGELDDYAYEKRYVRKDGTFFWGSSHVHRINEQFLLYTVKDITEEKESIKALLNALKPFDSESIIHFANKTYTTQPFEDDGDLKQDRAHFRVSLPRPICTPLYLQQVINNEMTSFSPTRVCIKNISGGGLCFSCTMELPIVENFSTYFHFKLLGMEIQLTGHIVRHYIKGGRHQYGVQFNITEKAQQLLIQKLNNLDILIHNRIKIYDTDFCSDQCKKCAPHA